MCVNLREAWPKLLTDIWCLEKAELDIFLSVRGYSDSEMGTPGGAIEEFFGV